MQTKYFLISDWLQTIVEKKVTNLGITVFYFLSW